MYVFRVNWRNILQSTHNGKLNNTLGVVGEILRHPHEPPSTHCYNQIFSKTSCPTKSRCISSEIVLPHEICKFASTEQLRSYHMSLLIYIKRHTYCGNFRARPSVCLHVHVDVGVYTFTYVCIYMFVRSRMSMCLRVPMYFRGCQHLCMCPCLTYCVCVRVHLRACTRERPCIYVCVFPYMRLCAYACSCVCVCACKCLHAYHMCLRFYVCHVHLVRICLCTCKLLCAYACPRICAWVYSFTRACMCVFAYMCLCSCIHRSFIFLENVCTSRSLYMSVHVRPYVCVCVCMYVHMRTHVTWLVPQRTALSTNQPPK